MPVPTNRDLDATRSALSQWLGAPVGEIEIPQASGYSNETLLLDADGRRLVVRIRPTGYAIFPEYDMALQYKSMELVGALTTAPVPRLVGFCSDTAVLGQPFYVMERVEGRVPGDTPPYVVEGWVHDASPSEQGTLYRSSLEAMAQIASIPADQAGFLDRPSYGATGLAQQVGYYEMSFEWALQGRTLPVASAATAWLHAHMPADPPPNVVNWGDSRPGNIIYDGFRPAAILDWEMASLGPAEVDLGYWLMFMDYHPSSSGVPPLPGFPDRSETISLYESLVGREMQSVFVYETFAWYRFAMVMIRISDEMIATGQVPPEMDFALDNPATQALAARL